MLRATSRAARAASCGLAQGVLSVALWLVALFCVAMGALCVAMRRAQAPAEEAANTNAESEALATTKPESEKEDAAEEELKPRVSFRLMPPPAHLAAAAQPFSYGDELYSPRGDGHGRPSLEVALPADTPASALLALCAAWLRVPRDSVQGPKLTLSPASPRRTVAQAGLGESSSPPAAAREAAAATAAVPVHSVFSLPFCCICLEAATGAVWSCRAVNVHSCCDGCARRFAETRLALHPAASATLRCPVPGCPHTLLEGHQLYRLVNTDALRKAHAQRVTDQAARLKRVESGREVRFSHNPPFTAC